MLPARLKTGPLAASVLIVGVVIALAANDDGPVLCPFRLATAGYCPSCGLTRAAGEFAGGDIRGAFVQHPGIFLLAAEALALGTAWLHSRSINDWTMERVRRLILLNCAAFISLWILRLQLGSIPRFWL